MTCNEIIDMEKYIEDVIKHAKIPGLIGFSAGISVDNDIRIGLIYKTNKQGKIAQDKIKELFKKTYNIDKIIEEKPYSDDSSEKLYDIIFEVPEDTFNMIYILSKVK